MFGISRIDRNYSHCWFVRLFYATPHFVTKSFPDKKYKGKLRSKRAAKFFVAEQLKKHRTIYDGKTRHENDKGVFYSERYRTNSKKLECTWTATAYDKTISKCRKKTFNIGNIRSYTQGELLAWKWRIDTVQWIKDNVQKSANR